MARARRGDRTFALHFIDIDEFKSINDLLGHDAGDAFPEGITERLRNLISPDDMLARLGADEFAILQVSVGGEADASAMAQKVIDAVGMPFIYGGKRFSCGASIASRFTRLTEPRSASSSRMRTWPCTRPRLAAETSFRLYETNMADRMRNHAVLDGKLRTAIEQQQFVLYYQPQISAETGAVLGAEALLRWKHPEQGLIPPGEFLPRAEENGLIVPMNEWVLHEACREAKSWHRQGLGDLRISVNLSPIQFRRINVASLVLKALSSSELDPRLLEIEITETIVMDNTEDVVSTLRQISNLGVGISIDDFGTGYSSLNYIKQFPIDRIKIDQSFVRNMVEDPSDHTIVRTVANLGHSLGLSVVAEGVETEAQASLLRADGCDIMQGYLYGRPMPSQDFINLVRSHRKLELSA